MVDFIYYVYIVFLLAVVVNSRFVVIGSKDEIIYIYDMKKKIDYGVLVYYNGKKMVFFKMIMFKCYYFIVGF